MLKNFTSLEVRVEDRDFRFYCEGDSPLGQVYDSLCLMQAFVIKKINEAAPKKEAVEEEVKIEE